MNAHANPNVKRQIWIPILILSLMVNGFMAGLFVAKKTNPDPDRPPIRMQAQSGPLHARQILRYLPQDRRREILTKANAKLQFGGREDMQQKFGELRSAREALAKVIAAQPVDPQAVDTALANVRSISAEISLRGDNFVVEVLSQLTPDELASVQKQIKERPHKRGHRMRRQDRGRN